MAGNATYGSKEYAFALPAPANGEASLTVCLLGASETFEGNEHHVQILANGQLIGEATWDGQTSTNVLCAVPAGLLLADNTLQLIALKDEGVPSSFVYFDEFSVQYPRYARVNDGELIIPAKAGVTLEIDGGGNSVDLYDVSRSHCPVFAGTFASGEVRFTPDGDGRYVVSAEMQTPLCVDPVDVADLRRKDHAVDYLVIAPPELLVGASEIADYRAAQGMTTMVVDLRDIYSVFNYGLPDPYAIRAFLGYAFRQWRRAPRYVLLAGDGSYAIRDETGSGDCLIPPLVVRTSEGLQASDNQFVDFTDDGVPNISIGRIPVQSPEELSLYLAKVKAYEACEDWRSRAVFLSDNANDSRLLAELSSCASNMVVGSMPDSDLRDRLVSALNGGAGLLHYMGHAGHSALAHEGVLRSEELVRLTNEARPFVLAAASCSVGQFAIPGYTTLGESALVSSSGAVAVWGAGGSQYHADGRRLDRRMLEGMLGSDKRLGDSVLGSLRDMRSDVKHGDLVYNLLGDPALALDRPDAPVEAPPVPPPLGYEEWRWHHFAPVQSWRSLRSDDANGDGVNNYMAYVLGLDPVTIEGAPGGGFAIGRVSRGRGRLALRLRKRAGVAVQWCIEVCSDLNGQQWKNMTDLAAVESVVSLDSAGEGTMEEQVISIPCDLSDSDGVLFVRAKALESN